MKRRLTIGGYANGFRRDGRSTTKGLCTNNFSAIPEMAPCDNGNRMNLDTEGMKAVLLK